MNELLDEERVSVQESSLPWAALQDLIVMLVVRELCFLGSLIIATFADSLVHWEEKHNFPGHDDLSVQVT